MANQDHIAIVNVLGKDTIEIESPNTTDFHTNARYVIRANENLVEQIRKTIETDGNIFELELTPDGSLIFTSLLGDRYEPRTISEIV